MKESFHVKQKFIVITRAQKLFDEVLDKCMNGILSFRWYEKHIVPHQQENNAFVLKDTRDCKVFIVKHRKWS